MQFPVIFELNEAGHAIAEHPYCSEECRAQGDAAHARNEMVYPGSDTEEGMSDTDRYGFIPECEICGRPITQ